MYRSASNLRPGIKKQDSWPIHVKRNLGSLNLWCNRIPYSWLARRSVRRVSRRVNFHAGERLNVAMFFALCSIALVRRSNNWLTPIFIAEEVSSTLSVVDTELTRVSQTEQQREASL